MRFLRLALFSFALLLAPAAARAACTNPAADAGVQVYSANYNVMQYCNGTNWVNMGAGSIFNTITANSFCRVDADGKLLNCNLSAIDLSSMVTGNLPVTNLNSGTDASASTFWRGDGTWASIPLTNYLGASTAAANPFREGEVNTGLFSPASGVVGVSILGAEALRVTATGSVGIGTSNPAYPLDVAGGAAVTLNYYRGQPSGPGIGGGGGSVGSGVALGASAAANNPARSDDATTGLFSDTASTVAIATGGVERLRVTATGSVGIGTTTPSESLDLGGGNIAAGLEVVQTSCASCNTLVATCPTGKAALGGGCATGSTTLSFRACTATSDSGIPLGWQAALINSASSYIAVRVICANIK